MENYRGGVNRFWVRYRDTVIECNIPEDYADWYVKWSEIPGNLTPDNRCQKAQNRK